MSDFIFDLQKFAATVEDGKVTIPADDTYALDGVTYTAINDAQLNLDDDGKVSGVASGSVSAVVTGRSTPVATVDASDGAINFAATGSGSVLKVTRPFPMELISGEFNYKGNTLTTSAGARLAFVSQLGNYSLRDESVYESGATFTFTNTALNINSEHTTSVYTLTNGSDVRRLQIETFGPVVNNYSERGFRLLKGSSEVVTVGGYTVTATAKDDATLNLELGANGLTLVPTTGDGSLNVALSRNGTEILAGELNVTSGSITFGYDNKVTFAKDTSWDFTWNGYTMTATTTDEATLDIALTGNKLSFTPGQNDGGVSLVLMQNGTPVFAGVLNVTDGTITFDANTQKFSFTEGTNISLTLPSTPPRQVDFKVTGGNASVKIEAGTDGKFILTPDDNDGALQISVSREGQTVFQNTFSVSGGSIVFDPATQSVGLTKGTSVSLGLNNYTVTATATDDAGFGIGLLSDGRIVLTPQDNDGSLNIAIRRGNTTIFQNIVSVSGGSITVNPETLAMTLSKGTNISLSFGNYELNATTTADATVGIAITGSGIAITPTPGDGSLNITLNSKNGSMNANIEVLSGSFILSEGGKITVTKGTELQIDFGGGYIINFKATGDAGGSISLGADGITFAPNSADGGLQLSVTQGGQTRTASLDVTGSVTYKLDGSISLAKGTVVRNVFDSGRALTITANADASGSIVLNPDGGLTITPSSSNALTVSFFSRHGSIIFIEELSGIVNYNGGNFMFYDGTKFNGKIIRTSGNEFDFSVKTEGGSSEINFSNAKGAIPFAPGENATLTLEYDYVDGHYYSSLTSGAHILRADLTSVFVAGTTAVGYFPSAISLEKAGNYTLNGMNITTTKDDVQVQLSNYDTVMFNADAGIVFDGQEFSGGGIITLTNGAIVIENTEDNVAVNGTALNDNITNTGDNVTINALGGNDTINSSGNGNKIDGGAGNNVVSLGSAGSKIVFDGNTTVEGFKTGWGSGSDTLYINEGSDPGVDFKTDGLTFYDGTDSLTLDDVDDTAKVNLYYEASNTIARNVYIAQNDWYQVSNSDLNSGEGIYFVGTSATHNHGVDFSGVSQALNVTLNTDYDANEDSMWINNVYSIRGGAGLTTITGTDDSDTIIAGTGRTTIDGAGGGDRISLGSAAALVKFTAGDGSDSIYGFNANSTISIGGASYSSAKSGSDLILTVGSDRITLFSAGSLENPHIVGTLTSGGGSSSTISGGGSSSTISGGGSTSTTSGGGSSSTISGGGSSSTTSGGGSSSTTSGGGSSSTISGGGSSSTTSDGGSSSTTSGGGSSSTTSDGGSSSTTSDGGSSSTTSGGSSNSTTVSGSSKSTNRHASNPPTDMSLFTNAISSANSSSHVYTGGDAVITNYEMGEKIALGTPPTSGTFVDGNFVLTSASGSLVVENAADKVIEFTDGAGNAYIKAYAATNPGTIDGRGLAGFEIINGSEGNDFIYAGDGGSQLWGGSGTASDLLTGGAGTDIFVGGRYQGADIFSNAETKDEVHLNDATLSDIIATAEQNGLIAISFNNGNSVGIQSSEALSAAVILADGSKYRYNHATRNWQSA